MYKKFLDLGKQPLANKFLTKAEISKKEDFYNLSIGFNKKNNLVSILKTISSKRMFNDKYPYRSSMSETMKNYFYELSKKIIKEFNPSCFLEIGSNDGTLIKNFDKKKSICVEPCKNHAKITTKMGYKTYPKYWNLSLAKKIKKENKKIDLIYSANTISHIHDLTSVFKSAEYVLSKNGILIIEDPSLLECLKLGSYDQFYNEHIHVFSLLSISKLVRKQNMEVYNIERLNTAGGSIRYYIKRKVNKNIRIKKSVLLLLKKEKKHGLDKFKTYQLFGKKIRKSKQKLRKIFINLKKQNKKIISYGATAKSCTVFNYCNLGKNLIDYVVDTTPEKIDKYTPGTHIKIKKYKKNSLNNVDYAFLSAWNFKDEIFNKEKKYIKKGIKFITHTPKPRII